MTNGSLDTTACPIGCMNFVRAPVSRSRPKVEIAMAPDHWPYPVALSPMSAFDLSMTAPTWCIRR